MMENLKSLELRTSLTLEDDMYVVGKVYKYVSLDTRLKSYDVTCVKIDSLYCCFKIAFDSTMEILHCITTGELYCSYNGGSLSNITSYWTIQEPLTKSLPSNYTNSPAWQSLGVSKSNETLCDCGGWKTYNTMVSSCHSSWCKSNQ